MHRNNKKIIIISFLVGLVVLGVFNIINTPIIGEQSANTISPLLAYVDKTLLSEENGVYKHDGVEIPKTTYDLILSQDIENPEASAEEAQRILKDSGRTTDSDFVSLSGVEEIKYAGSSDTGLNTLISTIFTWILGAAIVLSILFVIIGSIQYMTTDAVTGKSAGKQKIQSAIGGLILALVSWLILFQINPQLITINFEIEDVSDVSEDGFSGFSGGSSGGTGSSGSW